jgi:glutamate dehydrogenase
MSSSGVCRSSLGRTPDGGAEEAPDMPARVASVAGDPDLARLCALYFRHAPADDLARIDPEKLVEAVRDHRRLAERRASGRPVLRLRDSLGGAGTGGPGAETGTGSTTKFDRAVSVVDIVTDDMPYLVESVLSGIDRAGVTVLRVLHPIVVVRRGATGDLDEVLADADPARPDDGALAESWIHIETELITDAVIRKRLGSDLERVLADVRDVVEDTDRMLGKAREVAEGLRKDPPPLDPALVTDIAELLDWFVDGHVTFLGYSRYELDASTDHPRVRPVVATGLGVLRGDSPASRFFAPGSDAGERATSRDLLLLSQASSPSRVSRPAYPDYVSVKIFDADGNVTGEHRFLGLLSVAALYESVLDIPVIADRVRLAIQRAGFPLESYSGQRMLEVISAYPREELFRTTADELYDTVVGVMSLAEQRRLRLFLRRDAYRRYFSCLVYLPRDRYTTTSRLAMQEVLQRELGGTGVQYSARVTESSLALLHVTVHTDPEYPIEPVTERIQDQLAAAVRTWDDRVLDDSGRNPELADRLRPYLDRVPAAYKEDFEPEVALADLGVIDGLGDDPALNFYTPPGASAGERRFKLFLAGEEVTLTELLPVLQQMGVEVVEERPYQLTRPDGQHCWIYDFGLRVDDSLIATTSDRGDDDVQTRFCEAFSAAWRGDCEVDPFNGLVLRAGLTWRQVALLRAYARYLRQIGTPYGQFYLAEILVTHPAAAEALVALFEARCSPTLGEADDPRRSSAIEERLAEVTAMIDEVTGLDADRILRGYLNLITSTLRTNYFARAPYLSVKLDPATLRDLPRPHPRFEIFVYSPRVEGVHLRFGPVARGGLRWSDRPADFRTEVLGLVKAQAVKNAVIVPVGAKGGFVVKRPPAPTGDAGVDREAAQAEGISCYKMFISGLLDLTDNLVDGATVGPENVVRHDGDDSYLVVAADKGTATFSDTANELAVRRGFWLGDAFASGGSAGYDHKAMGITARGAWESVKRHFRELGMDTQSQDFTVVGVGDMSGDVFGNGMLLSEHIRLVAAFDHRHVFVDPNPDAAASFAERTRLFALPRSSWDDYDRELISEGGGVWSRTSKAIPVSAATRGALGMDEAVTSVSPPELMRAILLAPVDLFWNGGVGTYVKAAPESNSDVGDKANDPVRVDGSALRVRVIGEGGNLGLTQRGRIEFARAGGKLGTDALDNSAGVDCSDHEVNIKIPLGPVMASGMLDKNGRDSLLQEMTDDVAALVLADNVSQNAMLGVARSHAPAMASVHGRLVTDLESRGHLDRALDVLPDASGFAALERAGQGLTSPELATLMAHVKLDLKAEILRSDLPDQAAFTGRLPGYFPAPLRERYADAVAGHPLRREIVTTQLVNDMVDGGGISFAYRLSEELSAGATDALRAYVITTAVFGLADLWDAIDALTLPGSAGSGTEVADGLVLESRRLLDRAARWFLTNRPQPLAVNAEMSRFGPTVAELQAEVPALLLGREGAALAERVAGLVGAGVEEVLAVRAASQLDTYGLLDIVEVTELAERDRQAPGPLEVAELYFALSDHLGIDTALTAVSGLERGDRWHSLARLALRDDLYGSLRAITLDALRECSPGDPVQSKIELWERVNASKLRRARAALQAVAEAEKPDLATLSVVSRQLRGLAR